MIHIRFFFFQNPMVCTTLFDDMKFFHIIATVDRVMKITYRESMISKKS